MFFCQQGTNIAAGKARGLVVGTGLNTEIGQWAFQVFHLPVILFYKMLFNYGTKKQPLSTKKCLSFEFCSLILTDSFPLRDKSD